MKHIFLSVSFILFTILSHAQLDKKTWLLGGNGSFYSYEGTHTSSTYNATTKVKNININTSVGYFLIDKFVVGIRPSYFYSRGKETQFSSGNTFGSYTQFLIGPFVRYYFLQKDKQFNLLGDISYSIGTNVSPSPPVTKGSLSELSINGGIEVFFNSSIGMEFLVGYKSKYEDIKGITGYSDKKNGFNVGIGFQIHLIK
jgi:hypothetical protein